MNVNEKLAVISFDETYLSQKMCYDRKKEHFIGPHKTVQTVIVRGSIKQKKNTLY